MDVRGEPVLAGWHDAGRPVDQVDAQRRLRSALAHEGPARVKTDGPLAIASTGALLDTPDVLAVGDGHVDARAPDLALLSQRWAVDGDSFAGPLQGAFALLLWDRAGRRGTLVRDHMGERVWFVRRQGWRTTFATDLRVLLALLEVRPSLDPVTVAARLAFTDLEENRTLFADVERVEPGHLLLLRESGAAITTPYWSPTPRRVSDATLRDVVSGIRDEVAAAARDATDSAALTGVLLSGGLDSSFVAASLNPSRAKVVYSATFPRQPESDEGPLIESLKTSLALKGPVLEVHDISVMKGALDFLARWQVPDHSTNTSFWTPLLDRARSDGAEVVLDGEGGDERFGTAYVYGSDLLRQGRCLALARLARQIPNAATVPGLRGWLRIAWLLAIRPALPHGPAVIAWRRRQNGATLGLTPEAERLSASAADPWAWRIRGHGPAWQRALGHGISRAANFGSPDHFIRIARLGGVRERHPLGSRRILDLALSVPPEFTFHPLLTRPHMRRAMNGLVADDVRMRSRKSYFNAVRDTGLRANDMAVARQLLLRSGAEIGRFVTEARRRELIEDPGTCANWGGSLFSVLSMAALIESQGDPDLPARLASSLPEPRLRWR